MDLSLRPETTAALAQFRARRSSLLQRRGWLATVLCALGLLVLIALLDRLWLLPDGLRPWVSLAAYAGCAYAGWRLAWQYLSRVRDNAGAARAAESVAPELREQLLSAVELSQADNAKIKENVTQATKPVTDTATSKQCYPITVTDYEGGAFLDLHCRRAQLAASSQVILTHSLTNSRAHFSCIRPRA